MDFKTKSPVPALFTLVLGMLLFMASTAFAQEARGTITGKVLDANKAIVQGASVKITNLAMGTTISSKTNDNGFYQATYLIPGTYRIVIEASGFKRTVRDGIVLQVNDNIQIDLELEVGSVDQSVTITGDSSELNTTSGSLGTVVDSRRVAELPIPHGEPFKMIGLAGGVSYTRDPKLDRPFEPTHIVGYSVNGTLANRSDITIDGVPSTSTANANEVIASFVPPQDLIQEFKVQTATFDASFGNTEGGVTNLSTKAGTNSFHGTMAWTKMAPGLFANDFFANANKVAKPNFKYTRWGGTIGGPVWVPKIYNGRNKTFFMYGIEGIPESRPRNNGTPTIPSEKMRNGDFSELLAVNTSYQIYNPFTRRAVTGGRIQSDPFVGNIIPANLINPIARKFVDTYLPKPTAAGAADGTGNFAQPGLLETIKYMTNTIRIDHVINDRHRVFGRGSWYNRDSDYNNYYNNSITGEAFLFKSRQGTLDHVWTLNSTMVINTRYGYNRFIRGTNANPGNRGFDLTSIGFPGYYNNLIPEETRRFPAFSISGYQGPGVGGEFRPTDTHSFNSTMNQVVGPHSLKYGMEFRSYRETDKFFASNQTGQFNFDATWTRGPLDNSATAPGNLGQSFAAFLLGLPTSATISQPADYAEQSTTTGVFIQDDWKVNSKLTINLGLRYEVEGALTERYNRSVRGFDFFAAQPIEAAARATYARNPTQEVLASQFNVRGGLTFAGINGEPRGVYKTPRNNYMPRLGFAYRLTNKTVVRGGYGIFFGFLGQRRGDVNQTGFATNTAMTVSLNNGLTFLETLSNPFAAFQNGLNAPRGAADGAQTFLGQGVTFYNPKPLSPYHQRWELSLQREFGGWVAEAAYVGNRGTHIEMTRNLNVTPQKYLSKATTRDNTTQAYLTALLPNPFSGLMPANAVAGLRGTTIARQLLLRPYPQFDSVNTTTNEGYSWYHSLQTRLDKRFSKGYTLGMAYTFSKFMEAVQLLNGDDPRPIETISGSDRPHRFSASGIYELPFGKGRKFGAKANKFTSYAISGWQVSGVYQLQSGVPLEWGNIFFTGNVNDIKLSGSEQSLSRWFNTNAGFVTAAASQPVSNVRTFPLRFGFLRSDKVNNIDLSLLKKTEILENKNLEFRAEFINAFNHVLLPGPSTTVTAATFGQIIASQQANYARRIQLTLKFVF